MEFASSKPIEFLSTESIDPLAKPDDRERAGAVKTLKPSKRVLFVLDVELWLPWALIVCCCRLLLPIEEEELAEGHANSDT